jgi:tetratricopeptide (TPR) repeat protein
VFHHFCLVSRLLWLPLRGPAGTTPTNWILKYTRGAIADHTQELEINPQSAHGNFSLGLALHKKGNYEGAIDAFSKAVELDGTDVSHYWRRCDAAYKAGLDDETVTYCEEAHTKDPTNCWPLDRAVRIYAKRKLPAEYNAGLAKLQALKCSGWDQGNPV